jgi:hypothetical protein
MGSMRKRGHSRLTFVERTNVSVIVIVGEGGISHLGQRRVKRVKRKKDEPDGEESIH